MIKTGAAPLDPLPGTHPELRDVPGTEVPTTHLVSCERAGDLPLDRLRRLELDRDLHGLAGDDALELGLLQCDVRLDLGTDEDQLVGERGQPELALDVVRERADVGGLVEAAAHARQDRALAGRRGALEERQDLRAMQ